MPSFPHGQWASEISICFEQGTPIVSHKWAVPTTLRLHDVFQIDPPPTDLRSAVCCSQPKIFQDPPEGHQQAQSSFNTCWQEPVSAGSSQQGDQLIGQADLSTRSSHFKSRSQKVSMCLPVPLEQRDVLLSSFLGPQKRSCQKRAGRSQTFSIGVCQCMKSHVSQHPFVETHCVHHDGLALTRNQDILLQLACLVEDPLTKATL